MATRYSVVCEDDQARAIRALSRRYGITEEEVLAQLVEVGLEQLEQQRP